MLLPSAAHYACKDITLDSAVICQASFLGATGPRAGDNDGH